MKTLASTTDFNDQFDLIPNLKEYPFVGSKFDKSPKRILVYGDNAAVKDISLEQDLKNRISSSMNGYVFTEKESWNKAFRNFMSMSTNQNKAYSKNSEGADKIIDFGSHISFANFINGVVQSPSGKNVKIENIKQHLAINEQILGILKPTHIVCWGDAPFGRLKRIKSIEIITQTTDLFGQKKRGFAIAELLDKSTNQKIKVLRIHHPGYDNVGPYLANTHSIMNAFYES